MSLKAVFRFDPETGEFDDFIWTDENDPPPFIKPKIKPRPKDKPDEKEEEKPS